MPTDDMIDIHLTDLERSIRRLLTTVQRSEPLPNDYFPITYEAFKQRIALIRKLAREAHHG